MSDLRLLLYKQYGDNMRVKLRINKTKKGTEFLFADFIDNNGKRQRKALNLDNTPKNRKLAESTAHDILAELAEERNGEWFKINKRVAQEAIDKI